jgi:membrane protein
MRILKDLGSLFLQAGREFGKDDAMAKAAALAFYTALGMAPMLLLTFAIASFLPDHLREGMIHQIEGVVDLQQMAQGQNPQEQGGDDVASAIDEMVESAQRRQQEMSAGIWSLVIGVATLLFSAGGVFAELQSALNKMWDVEPHGGAGTWVKRRLLSLGMLVAVLFIMLVSLFLSTAIEAMFPREGHVWKWTNSLVSLGVFTLIFALIYKVLPDVTIAWRDVWVGAAVTALLFSVGKYSIALYIGHQSFTSSYGAAGSLIALLAWVYYSSNIVFFGAELTQVFARRYGTGIHPYTDAHRRGASHKATPDGA